MEHGWFTLLAAAFDPDLNGAAIDSGLEHCIQKFKEVTGINLIEPSLKKERVLLRKCEQAKKELSASSSTALNFPNVSGKDLSKVMKRTSLPRRTGAICRLPHRPRRRRL
jgi:molecular chaperone DnaK (HSP70)